jgi:hypothetical protein
MNTKHPDIFAALVAPFAKDEVKTRSQAGRQFSYVTARVVMNRLDDVLGPENWWDEYFPMEHSVLCKLFIRLPDGSILTKSDAGGYAGMSDQGDDDKSGYSDSFKRAAVKFGVGRYLYRDGVPSYRQASPSHPDLDAWCKTTCDDINGKWCMQPDVPRPEILVEPARLRDHLLTWAGSAAKFWLDAKAKAKASPPPAGPASRADKLAETLKARGKDSKPTPAPAGREPGQEG